MDLEQFYFISDFSSKCLSKEESDFLDAVSSERRFRKASAIFSEGDVPTGVYILKKGKVKLYQVTACGSEQIFNVHTTGEIFGYRPILCGERYPVGATCVEDSDIVFIPKEDFLSLLSRSNNLSNTLLRFLSHEFTVWTNTISNLAHRTVRERVLINLLILSEKYRVKNRWPVEITLSRRDLAALTGTSNETLARTLSKIKLERTITTDGRTIVISAAQSDRISRTIFQH